MRWIKSYLETVLLSVALANIAAIVLWWSVFSSRLISDAATLSRTLVTRDLAGTSDLVDDAMAAIDSRAERMQLMIYGEMGTLVVALLLCVVALFVLSRRRRQGRERLEKLLQVTTHELKTPIAGVRALLQSLALGSIPAESSAEFLAQGVRECDRLEHLAETMLAYQRALAHRDRPRLEALSARSVVGEVLEGRAKLSSDPALRSAELAEVMVLADKDSMRVVLENLLDNARKYGGAEVNLQTRVEAGRFLLEVRDTGVGFAPENAETLFDPFTEARRGAEARGSGLGLSIARQLARLMGGALTAVSPGPGKGRTFTRSLALAPARLELPSGSVRHA
jgi:two-component system sensor histidine kinase EvgS